MMPDTRRDLQDVFDERYGDAPRVVDQAPDLITSMAARGSCRAYQNTAVPNDVLHLLCATALASPTKSDLQQRDIILVQSPDVRKRLCDLVSGQTWVQAAPVLIVFCGNNRRQRLLHAWKGVAFANDHLDAFFNAVGDAAIALGAFVTAAEAMGLGCCPISAVRNEAEKVADLLGLPDHVFPFAGLALGYPAVDIQCAQRLPLGVTCHVDRYQEEGLEAAVQHYDDRREATQPYDTQRLTDVFGEKEKYVWSDDKTRQYSLPERSDFGQFVRSKGFKLD